MKIGEERKAAGRNNEKPRTGLREKLEKIKSLLEFLPLVNMKELLMNLKNIILKDII